MILGGSFYTVLSPVMEADTIRAILKINPDHAIFKGHFPGQPVVPGVCMLQIVKELVEKAVGSPTRLHNGHDLKFLSVIDPRTNNLVNLEANYTAQPAGNIHVTARLFHNETTFFKFKGVFVRS